ncbi:hypothetical protein F5Y06DRAFT_277995 [Hypoxylon sp. FL0890]|nr:hypothetical protein F5Y06DRAFT_277995 [Hypoxylon sp. FL0890]
MAPLTRRRAKASENNVETKAVPATSDAVKTAGEPVQEEPVSSSGKRKSTGDANDSDEDGGAPLNQEEISPKRQRLAVRTRGDQSTGNGRKTHLEVEIPSNSKPKRPRSSAVPDSQDIDGALESEPDAEPSSASKQLEEEASQRLVSQSVEPDPSPMPKPKSKHIVFGDDDDVENFVASAAAAAESDKKVGDKEAKDEEEGSDDDDAPEAVSTQAVAKEMHKAALAASEAAEKQAASLKRKRQEKDSLYKQQAERRKRARGTVEVHQNKAASKDQASSEEDDGVAEVETAVTTGRRRAQKFNLPTVLPAEFLTDSSEDEDEDETALKRVVKKPKKINFETEGKRPRDQVVGSTRYRVLADQGDQKLAPRIRKQARATKESLLKRRRSGAVASAGMKKGFFVRR